MWRQVPNIVREQEHRIETYVYIEKHAHISVVKLKGQLRCLSFMADFFVGGPWEIVLEVQFEILCKLKSWRPNWSLMQVKCQQ